MTAIAALGLAAILINHVVQVLWLWLGEWRGNDLGAAGFWLFPFLLGVFLPYLYILSCAPQLMRHARHTGARIAWCTSLMLLGAAFGFSVARTGLWLLGIVGMPGPYEMYAACLLTAYVHWRVIHRYERRIAKPRVLFAVASWTILACLGIGAGLGLAVMYTIHWATGAIPPGLMMIGLATGFWLGFGWPAIVFAIAASVFTIARAIRNIRRILRRARLTTAPA